MIHLQTITNVSDCIPLYLPHSLYLKPVAKLSISVGLPPNKMGKSISNFDIMDKLTKALAPDKFLVLKVSKSTIDVIRLEAELEEPTRLPNALSRLDGMTFKVNGFSEPFKVRAKESKDDFPNRHDWDIFFRDAHFMDEMKAGERPDTIHLANLPIRWFCPRHMENEDNVKPSESIFKRIFEKFGQVRAVDIPLCDAYRQKISSDVNGIRVHNFEQDLYFEGYVQFEEYIGFVRAMDEFRGMKLVRKFVDKTQAVNIIVDFDKRKHLSDASVTRRERLRKSLLAKVKAREEEEERKKKKEQDLIERERKLAEELKLKELERQREREEQRKKKHLKKLEEKGQIEISRKIRLEEKKLLIVRRKLESIRVLEALFERLKLKDIQEKGKPITFTTIDLRQRLIDKYKSATEKLLEEQKKKLEEEKLQTGLSGLLKNHKSDNDHSDEHLANGQSKANGKKKKKAKSSTDTSSSSSEEESDRKKGEAGVQIESVYNPFKDVYSPEAAAELMKMSMMSYGMFQGMPVYRPPFPPHHGIRGYIPRGRGGHMRGMRRGGYGYNESPAYSSEAAEGYAYGMYPRQPSYRQSYPRSYNVRSYSRSRSRKRSKSRSRSRTRSRTYSKSRSRTRSRHRRYSRSRRSRNRSYSRSRSRSRTRSRSRSKRSRTRDHSRSRPRSESRVRDNHSRAKSGSQVKTKSHSNRSKSERSHSRSRPRHRTRSKTRSQSKSRTRTKRSTSKSNRDRSKSKSPLKSKASGEAHTAPKSNRDQSRSRSKSKSRKHREASTATKSNRDRSKSRSPSKPKSSKENHYARSTSKDAAHSKVRSESNSKSRRLNSNSEHKSKSHKTNSRSRTPNKSESRKSSKKLVSTRRSLSQLSWSRSPSPPRRSWSKSRDS